MLRDRFMAENTAWILQQEGDSAKIALWAHNLHVGTMDTKSEGVKSQGAFLREEYGDSMVTVGFDFYRGSFRAIGPSRPGEIPEHEVGPARIGSYEYYFHSADIPRFFLDLRASRSRPIPDWLRGPLLMRSIGAVFFLRSLRISTVQ